MKLNTSESVFCLETSATEKLRGIAFIGLGLLFLMTMLARQDWEWWIFVSGFVALGVGLWEFFAEIKIVVDKEKATCTCEKSWLFWKTQQTASQFHIEIKRHYRNWGVYVKSPQWAKPFDGGHLYRDGVVEKVRACLPDRIVVLGFFGNKK